MENSSFASFGVINFAGFVLGTIAIVLLPGPNSLYVLSTSARRGLFSAFCAALGILLGDALLMFTAATGATAVLNIFPLAYWVLRVLGALYLAWIGGQLIQGGVHRWCMHPKTQLRNSPDEQSLKRIHQIHPTRAALILSLTNPKAIFFFLSFFTQFVDVKATNPWLAFFILGSTLELISFSYLSGLIIAGTMLSKAFHEKPRIAATGMCTVGFIFMGFGIGLLLR